MFNAIEYPADMNIMEKDMIVASLSAGGCVVRDDDPKWECKDCGNRF